MTMKQTFTAFVKDMKNTAIGPMAQAARKSRSSSSMKIKSPKPPLKAKPVKLGKVQFWPPDTPANHLPLPIPPGAEEPIKPKTFKQFFDDREKQRIKASKKILKDREKERIRVLKNAQKAGSITKRAQ